jgi:23S rRNA pseudouridine1911/1915/1917 synthase
MGDSVELTVPSDAAGSRLDAWLAETLEVGSRAFAQRLIDTGRVRVDGRPRPKGHRLAGGERVSDDTSLPDRPVEPIAAEVPAVWEDDGMMLVDKPAGVVLQPAPGHRRTTLVEHLAERAGGAFEPLVVHRLDRDTSGLMLVAKSEPVRRRLQEQIRRREVEREYLALVKGRVGASTGTIEMPLGRDLRRRTRMSSRTATPRPARTHFAVERFLEGFTLVRARLETGRTHQIRAHFAAAGHPVCGDPEYGGRGLLGLERQFLHSARLALPHPESGRRLELRSALPADLAAALKQAGRHRNRP